MGLFDASFKSKEIKDLYDLIKEKLYDYLKDPTAEDNQSYVACDKNASTIDQTSAEQKTYLKNLRKSLEQMPGQVSLHSLDFSGKELSSECVIALLRAINKRNETNQLLWPVSSLSLNGTQFTSSKKRSVDKKIQQILLNELCEYLNSTKTLVSFDISNNSLGVEFMRTLITQGIRFNNSIKFFNMKNVDIDGRNEICDALLEIMIKPNSETQQEIKIKRVDQSVVTINNSLRSIDISSNNWRKDGIDKLMYLTFICARIKEIRFQQSDDAKRPTFNGKTLEEILKRNNAITEILDEILGNILTKRSFKEKLQNFKSSVTQNRFKTGNKIADETTPIYKVIAQQNEEGGRFDPFHPILFPSARWKVGYAISVGRREEMQDVVALRGKFRETVSSTGESLHEDWWAVYDGHGGREAAYYASENLHQLISSNLDRLGNAEPAKRADAIRKAFKQCQKDMAAWNTITGTTVLGLYIHENIRYIVNLGDSRGIVYNSRDKKPKLLTHDHRANNPEELKRLQTQSGAFVEDGKLNGKLSVTRALGDSSLAPYVSCIPDVEWAEISVDDEFIVLASDGLWDVFGGEGPNPVEKSSIVTVENMKKFMQGCQTVVDMVNKSASASSAAKKLVQFAHDQGSTDNISVIVIFLNRRPPHGSNNDVRQSNMPKANPLFNRGQSKKEGSDASSKKSENSLNRQPLKKESSQVSLSRTQASLSTQLTQSSLNPKIEADSVMQLTQSQTAITQLALPSSTKKSLADAFVDEMLQYLNNAKL